MVSRFSALQKTCKNIEMAANASVFQLCVGVVRPRGNRVRLPRAVAVATACGRPRLPRAGAADHAVAPATARVNRARPTREPGGDRVRRPRAGAAATAYSAAVTAAVTA